VLELGTIAEGVGVNSSVSIVERGAAAGGAVARISEAAFYMRYAPQSDESKIRVVLRT
jgi:hypothetical protein